MHLCAKVALASKVLQDLKLQKPDCPVAKPWGEKKIRPLLHKLQALSFFPDFLATAYNSLWSSIVLSLQNFSQLTEEQRHTE